MIRQSRNRPCTRGAILLSLVCTSFHLHVRPDMLKLKQAEFLLCCSFWAEIMPLRAAEDSEEEEQNASEKKDEAISGRRLIDLVICTSSGDHLNMVCVGQEGVQEKMVP
jgi:hypothetical protein